MGNNLRQTKKKELHLQKKNCEEDRKSCFRNKSKKTKSTIANERFFINIKKTSKKNWLLIL